MATSASARPPAARESLVAAVDRAVADLGGRDTSVGVFAARRIDGFGSAFADRFPDRFHASGDDDARPLEEGLDFARSGGTAFVLVDVAGLEGLPFGSLRTWLGATKVDVNLIARHPEIPATGGGGAIAADLGILRGIPGVSVVVPGDAPTAGEAVPVLAAVEGPAYLRVTESPLPRLSVGSLTLGKANELREGTDLTFAAIGRMLPLALEVAEEFAQVGVEVRVLDAVSFQPFDAKAILRAARETGALLTLEEHSTATGLGALVATITAEAYPVPVRRVGIPPVVGLAPPTGTLLTGAHARDEAWELLRARGKVT